MRNLTLRPALLCVLPGAFCVLLTALFLFPAPADAARIEAVKGKKYELTKRHGPWMIMVASLYDENAEPAADALVYELRTKGIPAYSFHQDAELDTVSTIDRFGRPTQRSYTAKEKRVAVIAGNYKNVEDAVAQKTLEYVKNMYPRSLGGGRFFPTPGKPLPLSGAFLTINPLLSPVEVAQQQHDPLLLRLNSGTDLSLLDNPGRYTMLVKTFHGQSITESAQKFEEAARKFKVSDSLDKAAMDAWQLAKILRSRGVDAYVFHDRNRSVVTVGSFNTADDPAIRETFDRFSARKRKSEASGLDLLQAEIIYAPGPKKGDPPIPWVFDPTPQLIDVPRLK